LIGVGEVELADVGDAGAAEGELPGADEGAVDGDWEVDAGVADVGVVEEVVDAGLEGVCVEEPAAVGDLDAELVLFVAFAVEWREAGACADGEVLDAAGAVGDGGGGAAEGEQRRGLVEAAVEAAEDPVEFGDAEGYAEAWVGFVFCELALKVGLAEASDEGEPGGGFVVVGDVLLDDAA
jgi:hypothetical protein